MGPHILSSLLCFTLASYAYGTVIEFNATFDNLPTTAVAATPVVDYDGVFFNAFDTTSKSLQLVGGVAAQSSPNTIITTNQQQGTNGTPAFMPVSPYKYIGLQDFYFGCGLHTDEAVADQATQCSIVVAGFAAGSDQEIALADFTFTPPTVSVASVPMMHAVLPSTFTLQKIVNVTVVQDNSVTEALLIDNVHYFLSKS